MPSGYYMATLLSAVLYRMTSNWRQLCTVEIIAQYILHQFRFIFTRSRRHISTAVYPARLTRLRLKTISPLLLTLGRLERKYFAFQSSIKVRIRRLSQQFCLSGSLRIPS